METGTSVTAEGGEQTELTLSSIGLTSMHLPALMAACNSHPSLRVLELGYNRLTNVSVVGEALCTNATLERVSLCTNSIEDVSVLATALRVNVTLRVLDLSMNKVRNVACLGEALRHNSTLETLLLDRNRIEDIDGLVAGLRDNQTLLHLDISGNSLQDVAQLAAVLEAPSHRGLRRLDVSHNAELDVTPIAQALCSNRALAEVSLSMCSPVELDVVASAVKLNQTLLKLQMHGLLDEEDDDASVGPVVAALADNFTLLRLDADAFDEDAVRAKEYLGRNRRMAEDRLATLMCGLVIGGDSALRRFSKSYLYDLNTVGLIFGMLDGRQHTLDFASRSRARRERG